MTHDLLATAKRCLDCADPAEKVTLTQNAWQRVLRGELTVNRAARREAGFSDEELDQLIADAQGGSIPLSN